MMHPDRLATVAHTPGNEEPAIPSALPEPGRRSFIPDSILSAVLPVLFSAVAYGPLLLNYFHSDDFANMYDIANSGVLEFALRPHGGHVLVLRDLIFIAFYKLFGLSSRYYFASVLLTHLLNVYLLGRIIRRITRSPRLACFGATLWGTALLHAGGAWSESSLGWYSVYGQTLATTLFLWVFDDLSRSADAQRAIPRGRMIAWYLSLIAGTVSFGVGIPIAMSFAATILLLAPRIPRRRNLVLVFSSLAVVVPALYLGLHHLYAVVYAANFDQAAGLIDKTDQWRSIAEMFVELLAFGTGALAIPYPCSGDTMAASCYAFDGLVILGMVVTLAVAKTATRRNLLAFLLAATSIYFIIAVGRGPSITMFKAPLEWGARQSRYHYAASANVAVVLAMLLGQLGRLRALRARWRDALLLAWLGFMAFELFAVRGPLDHHQGSRTETEDVLRNVEAVVDSAPESSNVYLEDQLFGSILWGRAGRPEAFPGWAAVFVMAYPDNVVRGRRLFFVYRDDRALALIRATKYPRINSLLVAPEEVPFGTVIQKPPLPSRPPF